MSDLAAVTAAREAVAAAQAALKASIVEARGNGASASEVAAASGYTRQRIYQFVAEARPVPAGPSVEVMEARLADLDGRYEALVGELAAAYAPADARAEQARRNVLNGRIDRAQRGVTRSGRAAGSVSPVRGIHKRPTVRQEARDFAESKLLRLLEDKIGEPRFNAIRLELDEAAALRKRLAALREADSFFAGV